MENPKLSVIVITLNEQELIGNLLNSLKKQTFKDFEIIVADANSTDRTREIAKNHGCKVVEGGGYSAGRNSGARASKSPYLFFVDADSELPPDFLEVNLKAFKESKKGTATTEVKPLSDRYFDKIFFKLYDYWSKIMSKISPHCCGASIFSTKEVFGKINGFDEKVTFAENHDYTKRAKKFGFIILPRHMFTSVRRMDKDGRFKFICKYIYSGLYRLIIGEIKEGKELFEYGDKRETKHLNS